MSNSFYSSKELSLIGFKACGTNVLISRYARFYKPEEMTFGDNIRIDDFCILSGQISLGSNIHISAYCVYYGSAGITLSDYSGTSPRCTIFSASDDFSGNYLIGPQHNADLRNVYSAPVTIGKYVQIGAGTIIMPGVAIEEGVAVGAMSMVNKSLQSWGIYAGTPAKLIKPRSKGLLKLLP